MENYVSFHCRTRSKAEMSVEGQKGEITFELWRIINRDKTFGYRYLVSFKDNQLKFKFSRDIIEMWFNYNEVLGKGGKYLIRSYKPEERHKIINFTDFLSGKKKYSEVLENVAEWGQVEFKTIEKHFAELLTAIEKKTA